LAISFSEKGKNKAPFFGKLKRELSPCNKFVEKGRIHIQKRIFRISKILSSQAKDFWFLDLTGNPKSKFFETKSYQ